MSTSSDGQLRARLGFLRVAAVTPEVRIADVDFNVAAMAGALEALADDGCQVVVFPELSITGYSCADLFHQSALLTGARRGLDGIVAATKRHGIVSVVGLPIEACGRLFNCAAVVGPNGILGIVPKSYLPRTAEFYELRWFTSGLGQPFNSIDWRGRQIPFGIDLIFAATNQPGCALGVEICEDLWAVQPPSGDLALAGATVLINLSASTEVLGKQEYRRQLVSQQSARCLAAYIYAAAGPGESSTDVVYSGHSIVAENGAILGEASRFEFSTQTIVADIDLDRLRFERMRSSSFSTVSSPRPVRTVPFHLGNEIVDSPRRQDHAAFGLIDLRRTVSPSPFVPTDLASRDQHCAEVFNIQRTGLARRLRHVNLGKAVVGLSGGLDSTLALLVVVRAFDDLRLDRPDIICVTMPGFGTSARTRTNAMRLAKSLGVTMREISIDRAVLQHFKDIGHDPALHDVTYENAQARERTQILMDLGNELGALPVGTGDLSELALGWCTYNGDHMSMYHVNSGVPKTLVRYLVEWWAERESPHPVSDVLLDIAATPISPELLPTGGDETTGQATESIIGPYRLHDFFLFYTLRHGFAPEKVFYLALRAFGLEYEATDLLHWMRIFYRRFFSQQFKRSAMPDGPKVGSVALSPRGDWRMPSDASAAIWMSELDALAEMIGEERPTLSVAGNPPAPIGVGQSEH